MYSVIAAVLDIVNAVSIGYCLQYYFDSLMEQKSRFWAKKISLIAVFAAADVFLGYYFLSEYESGATIGKMLLLFLVVFLLAKVFYNEENQMALFLAVTFIAIKDLCVFISMLISIWGGKLFALWIYFMEKGYVTSIETFNNLIEVTAVILQILMCAVFVFLLFLSLKAVIKNYGDKAYRIGREELLFLLTPGSVGFLLCVLLRTIFITVENDMPKHLYDKYPLLMVVIPAILLLALLSIVYSVKLFSDLLVLNKEKSDSLILEKQVKNMQEYIEEMEHIHSGVRGMKHDMKNTLSVIMQLALNEKSKSDTELETYLSELNQTMNRLDFRYKTGNSVVDILLNMKYHESIRVMPGLQFNADRLLFVKNLQIQSYDIGIIIGNALDNAMEACQKLRREDKESDVYITLSSWRRGGMLFIEVENSFDGKILKKQYSEFPITDKSDKKTHGIGLTNIKNTAEKYHGGVDWAVENKKFILTVMLQNIKQH